MSLTADQIVDRRSLRRRVSFWRVVAFVAVAIGIVAAIMLAAGRDGLAAWSRHRSRGSASPGSSLTTATRSS